MTLLVAGLVVFLAAGIALSWAFGCFIDAGSGERRGPSSKPPGDMVP